MFIGEFTQRFAGYTTDDLCQECVSSIAVKEFLSRFEVELLLAAYKVDHIALCFNVRITPSCQCKEVPLVPQSAGMIQKMPDGDGFSKIGHFRQMFSYIIICRKFSLLSKQDEAHCGELLGYLANLKYGRRRYGYIVFQVGHAVSLFVNDFTVLYDRQSSARSIMVKMGKNAVYFQLLGLV